MCFYSWLSFLDVEGEGGNCFLGFCQVDRSTVVWLGSFSLVSAGKVFLLLIILFGCGRRRGKLFPGSLSSGSIDSSLTRQFLTCKRRESLFTLDHPFWTRAVVAGRRRETLFPGVLSSGSTVVWLDSFSLVIAVKGFLLLISLLGRGPWMLEEEDNAFFSFLFPALLGSGLEDGV